MEATFSFVGNKDEPRLLPFMAKLISFYQDPKEVPTTLPTQSGILNEV
ncbi:MAG: hypothetical protein ACPLPP_05665 [Caldisericum exile]